MKRRAFLVGGVTTAVGGSALLGSGALSEADSQRVVKIEVEDDENAYLRLRYRSASIECEETVDLVEVTNHLKEEITHIDVRYRPSNGGVTLRGLDTPDSLRVGQFGVVTVDAECDSTDSRTTTVMFDVEVRSENHEVTAQNREIDITCECPDDDDEEGESGDGSEDGGDDGTDGDDDGGDGSDGDDDGGDGSDGESSENEGSGGDSSGEGDNGDGGDDGGGSDGAE